MANFTQRALERALLELLAERSFDKITVIDITKRCGVNRNTLYYHYRDIYDLLDSIFSDEEERILNLAKEDFSSWQDSFEEGIRWTYEHRQAIYNVYKSSSRDRLEEFLFKAGRTSASRFIQTQLGGLSVPAEALEDVAHILGVTITGLVLEWLNKGLQGDPRAFVARAAEITEGTVRTMLERAGA